jgi:hypothetical protein
MKLVRNFQFAAVCLFALHALSSPAAEPAKDPAPPPRAAGVLVPLVFDPSGGPWRGETAFQGASWGALTKSPFGKGLMLQAHAGLGDRFPVAMAGAEPLFHVVLENGLADHIVIVVVSDEGDQRIKLPRDKGVPVTVAGKKYTFSFPTLRVEAKAGEKPSTNKATIFVTVDDQ